VPVLNIVLHASATLSSKMPQTSGRPADIADRQRVWEVRRFCQVRTALPPSACGEDSQGDAALSALLRCLVYELDADLAAITLLDERTQHFLSVVHKTDIHDAHVRATKWYGCEQIAHRGGICEKTISLQQTPGDHSVYEIQDLSADESTKALPVVDGSVADFRHYVGVPLNTPEGLNVGTVFVFRKKAPTEPLPPAKCRFLVETASHAMSQLLQTVEALENKRSLRCNSAVSSMLDSHIPPPEEAQTQKSAKATKLYTSFAQDIHMTAANLLKDSFELDGVMIQELPFTHSTANINRPQNDKILAAVCNSDVKRPGPIKDAVAEQLLHTFPQGGIFHVLETNEDGKFIASVQRKAGFHEIAQLDVCEQIPIAEQFVFIPLRDSFHDRDVAFVLGWASDFARVYSGATDLPPLASMGMAIMTQVRRLEAQLLSRNKSDFLGSMSHEMRSPLHGMLACIDLLLRDTKCTEHQLDLLESAEACGLQLRGNIDNILLYSNIGSPSPRAERPSLPHLHGLEDDVTQGQSTMLALIEDTIGRDARKRKSTIPARSANGLLWTNDNCDDTSRSDGTVITVDANPQADFPLVRYSGISIIINNLLGNCLKFTGTDACVRVSLEADAETVKLSFIDAGRGMTSDFVKHNLLEPFAQQDPLDTGTGLGLALVQSAVQALGGETTIDTDESRGTEVSVSLPRSRLAGDGSNYLEASHAFSANTLDLSSLRARLFAPARWHCREDLRHQRSLESLTSSLARTLHSWLGMDFGTWVDGELPEVMFVLHADLERLEALTTDKFNAIHKIVLCSDTQAEAAVRNSKPGVYTTIVGPVTSSKVCAAVVSRPENLENEGSAPSSSRHGSYMSSSTNATEESRSDDPSAITSPEDQAASAEPDQIDGLAERDLPDRSIVKPSDIPTEPRFLLVDDNAINLKVIGMYAKKCTKRPSVAAAGGQEAIDAFKIASLPTSTNRFDIILLDLSMPEVSGFDVAATVRQLEQENGLPRTYIAALTGLVSDKDRAAAFAAGVDEYVTKPATLKDVKGVVANWKAVLDAPP
jgi:signal transduction histidine kinase/CheY-like chemotaxis protein